MTKPYIAVIASKAWTFDLSPTSTLLASAEQAGIRLASSCRNGTCRTCLCRLKEGTVRYEIEWPGLSFDEKLDGYILPCVAFPESDLIIEEVSAVQITTDGIPGP